MKLIRVGVDLAKNVFQVHGVDRHERPVWRRRLSRDQWLGVLLETVEPGCEIGMEACGGAHYWARKLQEQGFTVKLMAPQFVKPYVQSKQDIQAVHRIRSGLIEQRTAKGNQIRGLVAEYGLVAPRQLLHLRRALPVWLEDASNVLSGRFRRLLHALWEDLRGLDERVVELDREIALIAQSDPAARRLQQLRGVGPLIATALVAAVGDGGQFKNGRQMAAALGLTPKQHNSGGKERQLGISKRGDAYLRTVMIHGARSAIKTVQGKRDRLSQWVMALAARRHPNVVATALANKNARIAWAMPRRGTDYRPDLNAT